jgi:catechol 2,3-dioxygenase-like lactoylglutathione lyase family enzyme
MSVKLDHIYLSVKNMDRAVLFWEDLLETKVKHRENNTWADFDNGSS